MLKCSSSLDRACWSKRRCDTLQKASITPPRVTVEDPMETSESYFERKHQELELFCASLEDPLSVGICRSVEDVVKSKFQLAAALRAEHERRAWKATETSWSHANWHHGGPFKFTYDYQRADLDVTGPCFYELDPNCTCETSYAASGMAAMSACLVALGRVMGPAELIVLPRSYGETIELVENYLGRIQIVRAEGNLADAPVPSGRPRILLLDSAGSSGAMETVLRITSKPADILLFDTTCFASTSSRIRRVLQWARKLAIPVAMVRSHTKLDSLGAEYGRLGSVVFVDWDNACERGSRLQGRRLATEARNAIRLLGSAAVPAHFPPYVGSPLYRTLSRKRVAGMLRNCRRAARIIQSELADRSMEVSNHGLYLTLRGPLQFDEAVARKTAAAMSEDLSRQGVPIRHAGSFGFDFAATEWFQDSDNGEYSVRVAIPDIPTALCEQLSRAVANWWSERHGRP